MIINLISDTLTKPSDNMLKAMLEAEVGDDVFKEDPTVNKLEEIIAKTAGKLVVPAHVPEKSSCLQRGLYKDAQSLPGLDACNRAW